LAKIFDAKKTGKELFETDDLYTFVFALSPKIALLGPSNLTSRILAIKVDPKFVFVT
jgi:hypothetical protein